MQTAHDILDETAEVAGHRTGVRTAVGGLRSVDPVRAGVWGAIAVAACFSWYAVGYGIAAVF